MFHFNCRGRVNQNQNQRIHVYGLMATKKAMIQLARELFWKMGEDLYSIAKDHTASLDAFIT
jgi:hypothetical protein